MSHDPAFLFYPGDWLGGTMGLTFEEKGAYLELLIFQFNNGKFSKAQAKQVLSICEASVFQNVLQKFDKEGDLYYKQRLSDEIEKRKLFSESRRNNAKSVKSNKKEGFPLNNNLKTEDSICLAYAEHMENENISCIGIGIKSNKESLIFLINSNPAYCYNLKQILNLTEEQFNQLLEDWAQRSALDNFRDDDHRKNSFRKYLETRPKQPESESIQETLKKYKATLK